MPKVSAVHPILATHDVRATLDFFERVLGFTHPWSFHPEGEDHPPLYGGATLDGHEVHFAKADLIPDMGAYFEIDDVDAYHAEITAKGAEPTDPVDQPYGMRDFAVTAPGGSVVGFASRVSAS